MDSTPGMRRKLSFATFGSEQKPRLEERRGRVKKLSAPSWLKPKEVRPQETVHVSHHQPSECTIVCGSVSAATTITATTGGRVMTPRGGASRDLSVIFYHSYCHIQYCVYWCSPLGVRCVW